MHVHPTALDPRPYLVLDLSRGLLRAALKRWAFNTARRDDPNCPDDVRRALRWATSHT